MQSVLSRSCMMLLASKSLWKRLIRVKWSVQRQSGQNTPWTFACHLLAQAWKACRCDHDQADQPTQTTVQQLAHVKTENDCNQVQQLPSPSADSKHQQHHRPRELRNPPRTCCKRLRTCVPKCRAPPLSPLPTPPPMSSCETDAP